MADQTVMNEAIAKAVVEATRAMIQTMVESHQRQEVQGPKLGGPVLKQPQLTGRWLINTQNGRYVS